MMTTAPHSIALDLARIAARLDMLAAELASMPFYRRGSEYHMAFVGERQQLLRKREALREQARWERP